MVFNPMQTSTLALRGYRAGPSSLSKCSMKTSSAATNSVSHVIITCFSTLLPPTPHPSDGYGFCTVPTVPGIHDVKCVTWKPATTYRQQFSSMYDTSIIRTLSSYVLKVCPRGSITPYLQPSSWEAVLN